MHNCGQGAEAIRVAKKLQNATAKNVIEVLLAMSSKYNDHDLSYLTFKAICSLTNLSVKEVRTAVRYLARRGLAQYGNGLFNEDGEVAGSGYSVTFFGNVVAKIIKE